MFKYVLIFIVIVTSGCAGLQKKEVVINDNIYNDENVPSLQIEFPFKIYKTNEIVSYSEHERIVETILSTNQTNTQVNLLKKSIIDRFTYTGADLPLRKNVLYSKKGKKDNCSVYIGEFKNKNYLFGEVIDHRGEQHMNQILMLSNIGDISSPMVWASKNSDRIDDFTYDLKILCEQLID
jgi:hypothetical protein